MPLSSPDIENDSPLERIEAFLTARELPFDRLVEDELVAEMSGGWCNYRLWMAWDGELGAFSLTASYDMKIPEPHRAAVYPLLARINEHLFLGHFDLSSEDGSVCFRYGQLAGLQGEEMIESLFDLAVAECERFYPVFQTVLWGRQTCDDALSLVLHEPAGTA